MPNHPTRKKIRLQYWDYSHPGAYFVTLCTLGKKPLLSRIILTYDYAEVVLTQFGTIAEKHLSRIPGIDQYVIMPNHIHLIVCLDENSTGRKLTLPQLIGSCKSCISRELGRSIWQRSYYEHVIRNTQDYLTHVKYIEENPINWIYDKYYI